MAAGRGAAVGADEADGFLQRLEAGLAQQDRALARRRAFDHGLGGHAAARHLGLGFVDVQRARRQVVDVRALEGHHVGDQAVLAMQLLVVLQADGGFAVPAERVQGFGHEFPRAGLVQAALGFEARGQFQRPRGEDAARRQDACGLLAQRGVVDQFQAQQRGEYAERAGLQRLLVGGAKRGGVHRHAGRRQVVIAHGLHAHHGEHAAHIGQLFGRAHADGAMALDVQALDLARARQLCGQFGLLGQGLGVDLGDQVQQRVIQGHFRLVHVGHGAGEPGADLVGADEILIHGGLGASVDKARMKSCRAAAIK